MSKENKNLYLTELGEVVNNMMKQAFPTIVETDFTANMEGLLDCVEEGTVNWKTVVENFYPDLEKAVEAAEKELKEVKIEDEVTDVVCEECGRHMVIKYGPHSRIAAIPSRIWKRSVWHARNAARTWYFAEPRREENITAVRIIRNVISCPGRSLRRKNARSAAVIW